MQRRTFLAAGAAAAALGSTAYWRLETLPVVVDYPGRALGHWLRDRPSDEVSAPTLRAEVVIVGSGIAALTAAWKLSKEGVRDIVLIEGPEAFGNAAAVSAHGLAYPTGAHYLPLPSLESLHVREMLYDLKVILADPFGERPYYDERYLLHAPSERVMFQNAWQDGYLPVDSVPASERDQHVTFFRRIEALAALRGADARRGFTVPIELASQDEQFLRLDRMTFTTWLDEQNFTAPTLRWYLDYCCRDDYGRSAGEISAYAGLHYFAARVGLAQNAERGAVLTWPEGTSALARGLLAKADLSAERVLKGVALSIAGEGNGVRVAGVRHSGDAPGEAFVVSARDAIIAMPLYVAKHVVKGLSTLGYEASLHEPPYAPWLVSNFIMHAFPEEQSGSALAWDNVVYGSHELGYVVSTHQDIRQSRPDKTAFSAYSALADMTPDAGRRWLDTASASDLVSRAARDLRSAYGWRLGPCVESVEITARGHAMASPGPGYRTNPGLLALRKVQGPMHFAHADLSGYSVFEEASWWGYRAAGAITRRGHPFKT
jgi:glycine/D-amino acid oxidase-like deaminating enzyme